MSPSATSTRFLNPSRDGDSPTALGSLVQCFITLSIKKFFLICKPPLMKLAAIASRPTAGYLGEDINPHLTTPSFQVAVESDKVSPQPPLLQTEQPQLPQPLPISFVLQTLQEPCCPSLDMLQPLNVLLGVRDPKPNTALKVHTVSEVWRTQAQALQQCPHPPTNPASSIFFAAPWLHKALPSTAGTLKVIIS